MSRTATGATAQNITTNHVLKERGKIDKRITVACIVLFCIGIMVLTIICVINCTNQGRQSQRHVIRMMNSTLVFKPKDMPGRPELPQPETSGYVLPFKESYYDIIPEPGYMDIDRY